MQPEIPVWTKPLMIDQPLSWGDIYTHSKLQAQIETAICLDESIHNTGHALSAIELKACRIINIKLCVSASQRYWTEDIIEPEVVVTARGTIQVPKNPGIGYSVRRDRAEKLTVRRKRMGATH